MLKERWKGITGYECAYEVSTWGRVRGLDRIDGQGRRWKGRILKPKGRRNGKGYLNICLSGGCQHKTVYREIHRLVLETFKGPCPPGMEGCHKNGQSRDNRLTNLRWGTRKSNGADKFKHGTARTKRIKCSNGRLYDGLKAASRDTGVDWSNIAKAARGVLPRAGGFTWSYAA